MSETSVPRNALRWHLTASSLWMAGMSLQGFMFTWLIVGVLERPADEAGFARSIAEFPPLLVLLLGGVLGDRYNARHYLMSMHALMALPPLAIAAVWYTGALNYWWVVLFGVLMAAIQSLSDPARQAALSRVTTIDIQRTVTLMTIVGSLVGLVGIYVGGQSEAIGIGWALVVEAGIFFVGLFAVARLPTLPAVARAPAKPWDGVAAAWRLPLIRQLIGLNFLSSLFNAGAYIVAIPYVVIDVYGGKAGLMATVMIVFTCGSIGSNVLLYFVMPLVRPGRLFLWMQLTRFVILGALWFQPPLWLFFGLMFAWGLNMGVTTTMVRTTVQETATASIRAQILSVLLLSFMVSSPISATLLGLLIEATSPLTAMLPGMVISLLIFALGRFRGGLWTYRSGLQSSCTQTR